MQRNNYKNTKFIKKTKEVGQNFLLPNQALIYGKHSVLAALANQNRKIYQIFATKNNENEIKDFIFNNKKTDKLINKINIGRLNEIENLLKIVDNEFINEILPLGSVHQGLALKTSSPNFIHSQQFLTEITQITDKTGKSNLPKILILDNLTDPHNIGAIIRSSVAFNFHYIAFTQRNFPINSPIIAKSACGMLEEVKLVAMQNLNVFLADIKKLGYWAIGLDGEAKNNISEAKNYQPLALVLGSEGEGVRRLVSKNCDLLVKIQMNPQVESLNVSNAAAIAMYEITKENSLILSND